jgi:hypothetical protein
MDFFPVLFFNEILIVYGILEIYLIIVLALLFGKDGIELLAELWGKEDGKASDGPKIRHFPHYRSTLFHPVKQLQAKTTTSRSQLGGRFRNEIAYQKELYRWLNREFPVHAEVQTRHSSKRKTISPNGGIAGKLSGKEIQSEIITYEILLNFQRNERI